MMDLAVTDFPQPDSPTRATEHYHDVSMALAEHLHASALDHYLMMLRMQSVRNISCLSEEFLYGRR